MDYYAWKGGEISGGKALLNWGIGLVGFTKYGAPVSAAYFVVDAFYSGGWSGVGKDLSNFGHDIYDKTLQGINQYSNIINGYHISS